MKEEGGDIEVVTHVKRHFYIKEKGSKDKNTQKTKRRAAKRTAAADYLSWGETSCHLSVYDICKDSYLPACRKVVCQHSHLQFPQSCIWAL